jgi:hypothetical protein
LCGNDLQTGAIPVTPNVTPESEKTAILEALRGMGRDELLALLADALTGKDERGDTISNTTPNASTTESILVAIGSMSEAERGKLLAALLGLDRR